MDLINPTYTSLEAEEKLHRSFSTAIPCKHLVLDDFLDQEVADQLFHNFPSVESLNVKRKSLNENKAEDYHFERWHPAFSQVREVVGSKAFADWMSRITGVEDLRTTRDSLGSGVHQGANGSYVDVHVDVNMNPEAGLWRRVNLLIYLNKEWKEEYGGHLELWDKDMKVMHQRVAPSHNRAVIFYTDDNSPHGYSKINIPEGESRKSFYTYFYTEIGEGFRYRDSKFVSRPDEPFAKKMVTKAKEGIKIRAKQLLKAVGIKSLDFQDKNKDN
jgi:Rps23 Pro-64 3,4-dihydroxylase Tpa1-like proline 4-hydroxylase